MSVLFPKTSAVRLPYPSPQSLGAADFPLDNRVSVFRRRQHPQFSPHRVGADRQKTLAAAGEQLHGPFRGFPAQFTPRSRAEG